MYHYIDEVRLSVQDYCDSWFDNDTNSETKIDGRAVNSAD